MTTFPSPPINHPPFFMNGIRYAMHDGRSGASSIVLEKNAMDEDLHLSNRYYKREPVEIPEPIAGPVERVEYADNTFAAHCCNCGRFSKKYKRAKEPALWGWAARHRCKVINVTGDVDYKRGFPDFIVGHV